MVGVFIKQQKCGNWQFTYKIYCPVSIIIYKGGLKSSRPSLHETRDKWPLGRESDRSWFHRHTTSMIKLLWLQPMAPRASAAAYG